jgi:hypothetical protein
MQKNFLVITLGFIFLALGVGIGIGYGVWHAEILDPNTGDGLTINLNGLGKVKGFYDERYNLKYFLGKQLILSYF